MSRLFDDASSQYLEYAGAVVTSPPFTMACWYKSDENPPSSAQVLISVGEIGTGAHRFYLGWSSALGRIYAGARDAGGDAYAQTTTTPAANVWQHACAVFAAADDRRVYLNGGGKGTENTSKTPAGVNLTAVGCIHTAGGRASYWSGPLAWPCIWSVALSDAEVAALAAGAFPPSIQPASIVDLWDLTRNVSLETPLPGWGSHNLTVNGATFSTDNPPVAWPAAALRRRSFGWTPGRA